MIFILNPIFILIFKKIGFLTYKLIDYNIRGKASGEYDNDDILQNLCNMLALVVFLMMFSQS